jgi:hypothetical protein
MANAMGRTTTPCPTHGMNDSNASDRNAWRSPGKHRRPRNRPFETVDFKNTIVVMTSNIGSHRILEYRGAFAGEGYERMKQAVLEEGGDTSGQSS